ncbi:MAG: sigma-54 interaction domain-containing protein [Anaerovoracaceae bacterium]
MKKKISKELASEIYNILNAMHDDVLIADKDGLVVEVNKSFEKVYGISSEEAKGSTVYELESKGFFKPSVTARVLKTKKKITMRQENNKGNTIIVTATPIFDEDDNLKYVISFSRDITEQLHLEEENKALAKEVSELANQIPGRGEIVAKSIAMKDVLKTAERVASFDVNILITGSSGTGKTLIAKYIHNNSQRSKGPFVEINCAAIPENLLESELFGYEKGAFTGAGEKGKKGIIETASGGTLLLDEVSEMPINIQAKLLKVIQDKKILPVGGTKEIEVDFRLIAATNKKLEQALINKEFREDLFYRLNVISLDILPLAERKEDTIALINFLLEKFNKKYKLEKSISPEAMSKILAWHWPGNVRELENCIERAVITSTGKEIQTLNLDIKDIDYSNQRVLIKSEEKSKNNPATNISWKNIKRNSTKKLKDNLEYIEKEEIISA